MSESTSSHGALSAPRSILFGAGATGMALVPAFLASWQMYYFAPPADTGRPVYVDAVTIGVINLAGQIIHSIADGVIGHASDRTRTRWGRRVPWIVVSAPLCSLAFAAIWWPPSSGASLSNIAWLAGLRSIMWIAYTGAMGPYSSLLPEVSEGPRRVRLSLYMALFEVVGTVLATAGAGWLIEHVRDGLRVGPVFLADGYKVAAVTAGIVSIVGLSLAVSAVRERPHDASKEVPFGLVRSLRETAKNMAFRPYILAFVAFRIALLAVLTLLPYQVNVVLKRDDAEGAAGTLQMIIIVGAVVLFPAVERLARRFGKKKVMRAAILGFAAAMAASGLIGKLPLGTPDAQAYTIYALATFPVATLFVLVRPILADVIEHDAARTGYRREGIYNGVEGMLTKLAEGVGPLLAVGLFSALGASRAHPLGVQLTGPAAAVLCFVGWWIFRRYPIED
jgi:GPH family glycoside/pentoside/hexuronide:cation symporter